LRKVNELKEKKLNKNKEIIEIKNGYRSIKEILSEMTAYDCNIAMPNDLRGIVLILHRLVYNV
jgi:hypothetical protein